MALILVVFVAGCMTMPDTSGVRRSFLNSHHGYTVLEVTEQSKPPGIVEFNIKYKKPGDIEEHEDVWHYHQAAETAIQDEKENIK
jgi:hypothetical protein